MRILHLTKRYWPHRGGVERYVRDLGAGMARDGRDTVEAVVASATARSTVTSEEGVRVQAVASFGRPWSLDLAPGYIAAVGTALDRGVDVVHLHEPHPLGVVAWLWHRQWRRTMPPLVITWHADILRQWMVVPIYRRLVRRVLDDVACVILPTARHLTASPLLPLVRDRCVVVPFGIDLMPFIAPDAEPAGHVRRHVWGNPARVVLFVGRLVYYKGLPVLLDAMTRVDATLIIAGEGRDRAALEAQAARLGLSDRVRFLGDIPDPDLAATYHACDLLVLPSTAPTEAFGIVQLEAMACGKPVVSTRLPTGVTVVNRHGETGLTVPPGDAIALADALTQLLDDRAYATTLGAQARARVQAEFSLEGMIAAMRTQYARVVGNAT